MNDTRSNIDLRASNGQLTIGNKLLELGWKGGNEYV